MIYYGQYVLKMDDGGNDGARRGTVCHDIFEMLIQPDQKERVENILKEGNIHGDAELVEEVQRKMEEMGIGSMDDKGQDNFSMICDMIYVGLNTDFYCHGWEILYDHLETRFEISSENPEYVIRGLIDKPATKNNKVRIVDYKSSSQPKSAEELDFDIQSFCYILYAKKELMMDAFVEFVFLRYPDNPIRSVLDVREDKIRGFEQYLGDLYAYLKDFDMDKAVSNLAYDKGYIKDGGFEGRVVCGRATEKGQLKKDGSLMFCCPLKFKFEYFSLRDDNGNIIKSSQDKEDLLKIGKEENITVEKWGGCPKWN